MKATSGGAVPEPRPTPPNTQPLALPRSCAGNQAAMNWLEEGSATDSPRPRTNRTAISTQSELAMEAGTKAVATDSTLHQIKPTVSVLRGPSLPTIQPAGIWKAA